ncbi:ABC transporter substrate-binding protein [Falsiroseomonas sp. HW251]|uniref:ABC transporter substrate-binding protein n=1 Tax=Falsiroseomonas sp. HW251 TaxID=3390998 RepID=UPI003D310C62
MAGSRIVHRRLLIAGPLLAAIGRRADAQGSLQALATQAAGEDAAVWYESSRSDEADRVLAAFRRSFPDLRVRHESIPGGNGVAARVMQETMARGATGDIVTVGGGETAQLLRQDLISQQDYAALGVDPRLVHASRAVNTAVSIYCLVYNTRMMPRPAGWDDLLAPRNKGNVGTWVRAAGFAELSAVWGEQRVLDFYTRFLTQGPMFFNATAPLAQAVASGEIALGLGIWHNAQAPKRRGAPIDMVSLDPTPVSSVYTFVPTKARAPKTATVFTAWLTGPEGNRAYEQAVGRGSALIPTTQTHAFLAGKQISEWPIDNKQPYAEIFERMNRMVVGARAR